MYVTTKMMFLEKVRKGGRGHYRSTKFHCRFFVFWTVYFGTKFSRMCPKGGGGQMLFWLFDNFGGDIHHCVLSESDGLHITLPKHNFILFLKEIRRYDQIENVFSHEFSHVVSCPKGKSNYALWSWHLALLPPASLLKALNASLKWFSGSWKQWILSLTIFCNNISPGHMTFSSQGCKKLESRESQCCAHQCGWSYPSKLEIKSQAKHMYSNCFNIHGIRWN